MRHLRLLLAALALTLVPAAPALAVPDCDDARKARTILSGQGSLESVIAAPDGALYYTDTERSALMRLERPGAKPVVVADGIAKPGGLLVNDDGTVIVGTGDGFVEGAAGNLVGLAGLIQVDPATGEKTTLATGLSMANGLARDASGAIYASSDAGTQIDRVVGSDVERGWAQVVSPNGLAIESTGRHLLAAQTFQPAAIQRVDLQDPSAVEPYATAGPADVAAGLDGMTIDQDDRLFVTANAAGEVWRVGTDRSICALSRGFGQPSAVAFGAGGAFAAQNLYVVGFDGTVREIADARPAPVEPVPEGARLDVRLRPRAIRARRTTRVTVTVRRVSADTVRVVPAALVRARRKRATTDLNGRAILRLRPRRPGRVTVRVDVDGLEPARVRLPVRPAARGPRRAGRSG